MHDVKTSGPIIFDPYFLSGGKPVEVRQELVSPLPKALDTSPTSTSGNSLYFPERIGFTWNQLIGMLPPRAYTTVGELRDAHAVMEHYCQAAKIPGVVDFFDMVLSRLGGDARKINFVTTMNFSRAYLTDTTKGFDRRTGQTIESPFNGKFGDSLNMILGHLTEAMIWFINRTSDFSPPPPHAQRLVSLSPSKLEARWDSLIDRAGQDCRYLTIPSLLTEIYRNLPRYEIHYPELNTFFKDVKNLLEEAGPYGHTAIFLEIIRKAVSDSFLPCYEDENGCCLVLWKEHFKHQNNAEQLEREISSVILSTLEYSLDDEISSAEQSVANQRIIETTDGREWRFPDLSPLVTY